MSHSSTGDGIRSALRAAGLRATSSRVAVLDLLRETERALSHAEVAAALADRTVDRATLYRNLIDLEKAGLLRRTLIDGPVWRFEVPGAAHTVRSHPHFVCTHCGKVVCLPDLEMSVGDATGCGRAIRRRQYEVQLRGICDACGEEVDR